jgi:L-threonylcarbamoyladenylate synthase
MEDEVEPIIIEKEIVSILLAGGVGVIPTDTLYGLVGSALNAESVERIYKLRKRDLKKPMIILISSLQDLKTFGVLLNASQEQILKKLWPGKISVVFPSGNKKMQHLLRGGKTLAFRFPQDETLLKLLKETGPLVAPSANLAGEKPAETYVQAKKYFGEKIDFYLDAGKLFSKPSTIIEIAMDGKVNILRKGIVKIKQN